LLTNPTMSILSGRPIPFDRLFQNSDLDDNIRSHLAKVYSTLGLTLMAAALGCAAHVQFHVGGLLSMLGCLGCMIYLAVDRSKEHVQRRLAMMGLFGFLKGCSVGPLIELALHVDPSILVTAFLATTTIFACFTLSALFAKRRSYLYLGGVLSSALSALFLLSVLSLFVNNPLVRSVQLYLGLFMFCGYILFDTQLIIERVQTMGDTDYVWHAVELFTDFVAIFVRIVIILLEYSEGKKSVKVQNNAIKSVQIFGRRQ